MTWKSHEDWNTTAENWPDFFSLITSAKEVMFLQAFVCLTDGLSVCMWSGWLKKYCTYLVEMFWTTWVLGKGTDNYILEILVIRNTIWKLYWVSDPIFPWQRSVLSECFSSMNKMRARESSLKTDRPGKSRTTKSEAWVSHQLWVSYEHKTWVAELVIAFSFVIGSHRKGHSR